MTVYSCHATHPADQRIKRDTYMAQDGWRVTWGTRVPVMVPVTTDWVRKSCGVEPQAGFRDTNCIGCIHDGETTK